MFKLRTQITKPNGLMFKNVLVTFLAILACTIARGQSTKDQWVDSTFQALTQEQKIAQLFMVAYPTAPTQESLATLRNTVKTYQPGSILITRSGIVRHTRLLNELQALAKVPLLGAISAEWGLAQSIDSTTQFQKPMIQGALRNDSLMVALGKETGRQMKRLGLQINIAPNVDLDIATVTYPYALNFYGDDKFSVSAKTLAFANGLQQANVLACAKFTPDFYKDELGSEFTEFFELTRLDTTTLFPLKQLISQGIGGVMTSHLHFSMLGKRKRVPASVSELFVNDVLKQSMAFNGLTFSDIPYLKKIVKKKRKGEVELLAFSIGHDVLIASENLPASIKKIAALIRKNEQYQVQLSTAVKKILALKYESGLHLNRFVNPDNIVRSINSPDAQVLKQKIAEQAITIVRNAQSLLPIQTIDGKKFVSISIGKENDHEFNRYLSKYVPITKVSIRSLSDSMRLHRTSANETLIVGVYPTSANLLAPLASKIKALAATNNLVICNFGDPKNLLFFESLPTLVAAYSDEDDLPRSAAEIIFGGIPAQGQLPYSVSKSFPQGQSIATPALDRFAHAIPEEVGMDTQTLAEIKDVVREAIDSKALPGCQVIVARKGKIVFDQSFGWYTYDNQTPVTDSTIYDLASVTKVAATLQAVMFLADRKLIDLDKKAAVYLPELQTSNKKDLTLKDILTHQSGLVPFLYMWPQTMNGSSFSAHYYSPTKNDKYPLQVAPALFASPAIRDSVWQWAILSKMNERPPRTPFSYRYSDLGSMILHRLVDETIHQPMEEFLTQNLYEPLGATSLGYTPLERFSALQIAPTELDTIFRKQQIVGTVHDERAAMLGGIAGHAGLFGNALDLAKIGQMLLNKGHYGGLQFYKPETIDAFTSKQYEDSRRGLGWDKPTLGDWSGPTSLLASPSTFGHTGFTGTCIWVDPEFDLVFVFLSNRVYPDRSYNKISTLNIRPRIQDVIYRSIFKYCQDRP